MAPADYEAYFVEWYKQHNAMLTRQLERVRDQVLGHQARLFALSAQAVGTSWPDITIPIRLSAVPPSVAWASETNEIDLFFREHSPYDVILLHELTHILVRLVVPDSRLGEITWAEKHEVAELVNAVLLAWVRVRIPPAGLPCVFDQDIKLSGDQRHQAKDKPRNHLGPIEAVHGAFASQLPVADLTTILSLQ